MPYISKDAQKRLSPFTEELRMTDIQTPGELNFLITSLMVQYMVMHEMRYDHLNAVVGAAESAKAEFQRRLVNPYEQQKIFEVDVEDDPYQRVA
jgi:hypothetical protein